MPSKTVVIHQPDFLPYLGFFHRLLHADVFVILDTVQFVSGGNQSWHNRDLIKTRHGNKWITVSVKKPSFGTIINEVLLSDTTDWRAKNLNLIIENYNKSIFFNAIFPYIESLYSYNCRKLVDFTYKSIEILMELFDLQIEVMWTSKLKPRGKSNNLVVDILQKVNATHYLSGLGAKCYYDPAPYESAGIHVVWQNFKHPVYPQCHGEFIACLSSIDLLFNCGIKRSREILYSS